MKMTDCLSRPLRHDMWLFDMTRGEPRRDTTFGLT
jgi:hypothetical protein